LKGEDMRFIGSLLVLLVFVAMPSFAQPISETLEMKYYPISGAKLSELRRQLPGGRWGSTRWNIKHSASCDIDLRITVTLPRLEQQERLTPQDHQKYEVMFAALLAHEMDHVEILRKSVRDLSHSKCQDPDTIFSAMHRAHRSYDTRTIHGWRQGVRLN
jgi:predicted secreted Zn-dependent protease